MDTFVDIRDLRVHEGRPVRIRGWLQGKRSGGKVAFLLVRDGTAVCQCVAEAHEEAAFRAAADLTQESSLSLAGVVRRDDRAPGGFEVAATAIQVLQTADGYPIARKPHGIDFLLGQRHLWLRSPRQTTILRIRHTLIREIRDFFDRRGFTLIDTPILSPGAAEGAGSLFPVDYFGERIYLTQTGQLYLEGACMALGKVYCFGPTFRAEKSKTRRHLTEFWMVEPEIAFAELADLVRLAEEMLAEVVQAVLRRHRADLESIGRDVAPLEKVAPPFPRLTYTEAVDRLHGSELHTRLEREIERDKAGLQCRIQELAALEEQVRTSRKGWPQDKLLQQVQSLQEEIRETETDLRNRPEHLAHAREFRWGEDLGGDEETLLSRQFDRPVIITEYPKTAKAFYMKKSPSNPEVVLNLDVLAPEGYGEIIGGSQREDDLEALRTRMAEEGLNPEPYEWYLDLRRYGSVPHGGFGLGIERTLAWICGLRHIREAIPFPRLMGRVYP